jgi:hypothetical protein
MTSAGIKQLSTEIKVLCQHSVHITLGGRTYTADVYDPILFHDTGHVAICPFKGTDFVSSGFKSSEHVATNKATMAGQ